MTDEEIIDKAVSGINEMNLARKAEEDHDARIHRLTKAVMDRTGANFTDAWRYVAYAMKPKSTLGEKLA